MSLFIISLVGKENISPNKYVIKKICYMQCAAEKTGRNQLTGMAYTCFDYDLKFLLMLIATHYDGNRSRV